MPDQITLGSFVKQLTLRMEDAKLVMLFKDERPWHILFYRLKKAMSPNTPLFFQSLRFDWDGPYPRCQELSEFIQALHWTGSVVAANPSYDRIMLQGDVKKVWTSESDQLSQDLKVFLETGIDLAKVTFPHQE